jgi:hypothetical protein
MSTYVLHGRVCSVAVAQLSPRKLGAGVNLHISRVDLSSQGGEAPFARRGSTVFSSTCVVRAQEYRVADSALQRDHVHVKDRHFWGARTENV